MGPKRLVLLEFPSVERAREWWDSDEYAPAKALRQATSYGEWSSSKGCENTEAQRHRIQRTFGERKRPILALQCGNSEGSRFGVL